MGFGVILWSGSPPSCINLLLNGFSNLPPWPRWFKALALRKDWLERKGFSDLLASCLLLSHFSHLFDRLFLLPHSTCQGIFLLPYLPVSQVHSGPSATAKGIPRNKQPSSRTDFHPHRPEIHFPYYGPVWLNTSAYSCTTNCNWWKLQWNQIH